MSNDEKYKIRLNNDKTVKQLFDRFYIIRKDYELLTKENREFLEYISCRLVSDDVKTGRNSKRSYEGIWEI